MKKVLVSMIIIPLLAIGCSEFILRLLYKESLQRWSDYPYQADSVIGFRYRPNSQGIFKNNVIQNTYFFNEHGFPNENFSIIKAAGYYRILIVGNSIECYNTNGPLNYVKVAQSMIRENRDKVEIVNCSVDGSGRELGKMEFIKNECVRYKPDLVMFTGEFPFKDKMRYRTTYDGIRIESEFLNADIDSAKRLIDQEIKIKSFKVRLFDASYLFRCCCKYYFNHKDNFLQNFLEKHFWSDLKVIRAYYRASMPWNTPKPNTEYKKRQTKIMTKEESIYLLNDVSQTLSNRGIDFVFYSLFAGDDLPTDNIDKESNDMFVSLNFRMLPEYTFGDEDGHLTQEGHKILGQFFYQRLKDSVVPKEYLTNK